MHSANLSNQLKKYSLSSHYLFFLLSFHSSPHPRSFGVAIRKISELLASTTESLKVVFDSPLQGFLQYELNDIDHMGQKVVSHMDQAVKKKKEEEEGMDETIQRDARNFQKRRQEVHVTGNKTFLTCIGSWVLPFRRQFARVMREKSFCLN